MLQQKNLKEPIRNQQAIVIIGAGGHSKVIQDLIFVHPDYTLYAILDDRFEAETTQKGILYGPISMAEKLRESMPDAKWVIAIGQNKTRLQVEERLSLSKKKYVKLIHPTAIISPSAKIDFGSVVMAKAVVQADAVIGAHVIINTGSIVEHDCFLAPFAHLSPGAVLTGGVSIHEGAHVGASAVVIPGKSIGKWSVIGAGAAVITDIQAQKTAVGVPAIDITDQKEVENDD
ncbi:acetyltransferase [Bacillus sp. 179-C3.3 HS]|uniref:acetyltransferase n=1 Tax=Bacillus sp. 179-C3.3 HS TaxID=3232162 RepID=UPI0039A2AFAF